MQAESLSYHHLQQQAQQQGGVGGQEFMDTSQPTPVMSIQQQQGGEREREGRGRREVKEREKGGEREEEDIYDNLLGSIHKIQKIEAL